MSQDKIITNALQEDIEDLVEVVDILTKRAVLSCRNCSKPPSKDHNGSSIGKNKKREKTGKSRGGQPNHSGTTMEPVVDPDEVIELSVDREKIPEGDYTKTGVEKRQVFHINIKRWVTEWSGNLF